MVQLRCLLLALSTFIVSSPSHAYFIPILGSIESSRPFNLDHVRTLFSQSLQTDAQGETVLKLDTYISAYTELARVFDFFGIVFSFARDDIMSKLTTLNTLRITDRGGRRHYATFESMFAYEYSQAAFLLDHPGVNSNRWIHRALRFISRTVEEVKQENGEDLTTRVRTLYDDILAPHHSFFVRMAARLALNSFPSREEFLDAINVDDDAEGMAALTQTINVMDQIYDHVQELYDQYSS